MYYTNEDVCSKTNKMLFIVNGGIGKNVMGSAVIRALKKRFPHKELNVAAGCPEIFIKNPNVHKVHNLSRPNYLYEDYVKANRTMIIDVEPYRHLSYVNKEKHMVECWCDLMEIEPDGLEPEIFYSIAELEIAKDYLSKFDRRMVLFQHQGGKVPEQPDKKSRIVAKSQMYKRSLPEDVAQKVTDELIKMGYMVGSVGHANQFLPKGAEAIKFPVRAIIALVPCVEAVISIDSFLLHGAACFRDKTPTLGLWGGTSPKALGYPFHTNLARSVCDNPHCHRPNSFLFDLEETGYLWECSHNDICMNFSAEEIIEAFKKMMKEKGKDEPKPKCIDKAEDKSSHEEIKSDKCEGCPSVKVSANSGAN